ncbi:chromomethylase 3 [Actinidia rufa]|uniref:Cytosine-specific methyltransferase n=1 Tax=Actinidia rufa TaxID=165716 RepID=A0A7J0H560_9ERIC|nr:chromomethylase 3 [Actinidia rufa]
MPSKRKDSSSSGSPSEAESSKKLKINEEDEKDNCRFIDDPIPDEEARQRWPHRYQGKHMGKQIALSTSSKFKDNSEEVIQARCHYEKAEVDGRVVFSLEDDAHVKGEEGEDNYICRIIEMFEAMDGSYYFTAQWYYRAKDTVIKSRSILIDKRRVFFSEVKDDNPLSCLVERLNIVRLPLNVDVFTREETISNCDYYCDMMYLLPYSTFVKLSLDNMEGENESDSTISIDTDVVVGVGDFKCKEVSLVKEHKKKWMSLLDLYSGCGAMSTGLCLGANLLGVNLVTKWAVDLNSYACESLKYNHPETEVRNETAEDFLSLLKEWKELCVSSSLIENEGSQPLDVESTSGEDDDNDDDHDIIAGDESEVFEVEKVLGICYGDPKGNNKRGLYFKCNVDVICGGPPCQGISGYNRFRNEENPLDDPKNKQLAVFMDIIDYLKPRFVLMENVVDIVKFAHGFLGRYALARLVGMNYQGRLGMMAAGSYGLPQFRMRVFIWGAHPSEKLPQYTLPTHNLVVRGVIPKEFESNVVAYEEGQEVELEKELFLKDAIYDLPRVENDEQRDEMAYGSEPKTDFQRFIRMGKDELLSSALSAENILFDHRPLQLNDDDYQRVCQIPKIKGANFRHLKGVRVRGDKKVEWDPNVERVYLPSGKPLVPEYAMTFVKGTSSKPFGRLWWDDTVPTVVTRAEPHNQVILHPEQDRVLTIRENARLQGFPDSYKLFGPVKERYMQVGNAVAVPVSQALGYALGLASQGSSSEEPVFTLPKKFPRMLEHSPVAADDHV